MSGGERPIGAAKGKQSDTEALCQPPRPPGVTEQWPARAKAKGTVVPQRLCCGRHLRYSGTAEHRVQVCERT